MTPREFIDKIIEAYWMAGDLACGEKDKRLTRGLQSPISSSAEDWFAFFIASKFPDEELEFFIDTNISLKYEGDKKTYSIRPDLYIIKDNIITHYFDVKTDLGWNRNFSPYLEGKEQRMKKIQGRTCKSKTRMLTFSENIKYQVVLLHGGNGAKIEDYRQTATNLENVEMYVLTQGDHPNFKVKEKTTPNESEFQRLIADTKKYF